MLKDTTYIVQSLVNHLFFLRTIREFCLNIQLSFYKNNKNVIGIAESIGKRYEELGKEAISLAERRVPNQIIQSDSFVTDYTLNTELLTEKLFDVDINTNLTTDELNLNGFSNVSDIKYDDEILNRINELNNNAIELTNNFIEFCKYIRESMLNTNVFSYSYPLIYDYMIEEAGLYVSDLKRLQEKTSADPTYIINFEYYFLNSLIKSTQFIIGLSDPKQTSVITNADNYRKAFTTLMKKYQDTKVSPDTLKVLNDEGISLVENFRVFLSRIIDGILNQNYYFIVEPVFFDNILTETNYFLYLLKGAGYGID